MNIDKDIEILKELAEDTIRYKMVETDAYMAGAITRVLKELENKDEQIQELKENNRDMFSYQADLKQELETYKKIAEWLIRYSIEKSIKIFGEEKCEYARKNKNCPNFSEENCIQCIIEWARKEVEK
jgi:DNA-binding protein H-NS